MATVRGASAVKRYIAVIPGELERKVLRGAARAGMAVIKDEAAADVISSEVREALIVKPPKVEAGRVTVKLTVEDGWPRSVATWLEFGTSEHFISVDPSASGGRTAPRVNKLVRDGQADLKETLVINGKPVGATVHHPGATAHPFLRVALDRKEAEAIAAAQSFINARISPAGIKGEATAEDVE